MGVHTEFVSHDTAHDAVLPDHERGPLIRKQPQAFDAEQAGDLAVGVAQQGEPEVVLVVELLLPIGPIGADPDDSRPELAEFGVEVTEPTGFDRSTRSHRLDEEVDDQGPSGEQVAERDLVPVLVECAGVGNDISNFHWRRLARAHSGRSEPLITSRNLPTRRP